MKVNADSGLAIAHVPGFEPEEQPTQRVIESGAPVKVGRNPWDVDAQIVEREMGTRITADLAAGEIAQNVATSCETCAYFRPDRLHRLVAAWSEPLNVEGRTQLDRVRGAFTDNRPGSGRFVDLSQVDELIASCGVCEAITEIVGYAMIVTPIGGCPNENGPKGEDLSQLYKPRDRAARRASSKQFDQIMFAAAGKPR